MYRFLPGCRQGQRRPRLEAHPKKKKNKTVVSRHFSDVGEKFLVEVDVVHLKVREQILDRLPDKKKHSPQFETEGWPHSDVPNSCCARYRHDVSGNVCV